MSYHNSTTRDGLLMRSGKDIDPGADNGALLLVTQSGQLRFHSGDVSLRAQA